MSISTCEYLSRGDLTPNGRLSEGAHEGVAHEDVIAESVASATGGGPPPRALSSASRGSRR
jgi:hypothetical protein